MTRPTRLKTLMKVAYAYEDRSTCVRNHVGAVIALEGRIIMTGYNGTPAGMEHCDHTCNCDLKSTPDWPGRSHRFVGLPVHEPNCSLVSPCEKSVHAEANAIAFAAREGLSTKNADLIVTLSPCYACAQLVINAGLRRVVFDRTYRNEAGICLLRDAGIDAVQIDSFEMGFIPQ